MTTESPTPPLYIIRLGDKSAPAIDYLGRLLARLSNTQVITLAPEQIGELAGAAQGSVALLHTQPETVAAVQAQLPAAFREGNRTLTILRAESFWNALPTQRKVPTPPNVQALFEAALKKDFGEFLGGATGLPVLREDLLASCLWMITRAEEYDAESEGKLDANGRFLCHSSKVPAAIYDVPVVMRALLWIWRFLTKQGATPAVPAVPGQQTVAITHDVDLLRKYRGVRGARRLIGRMARKPAKAIQEAKAGLPVLVGGARDPYDSFDDLFAVKERISAPSTWFLMSEKGGPNSDYALSRVELRNILVRARGFHDEFALHSSWETSGSADSIRKESQAVRQATGMPVHGMRPHYLRLTLPNAWRNMASAGMRYSSSMAFPDRSGFRCGWSGPFRPFDLTTLQEFPLIEIPLVCMDVTLSVYEKIPAELALERLTNLLDASCIDAPGGAFVFLWHNTIADRSEHPGFWDTFEYFFSIASGSSTFVTLNTICDDYESRAGTLS